MDNKLKIINFLGKHGGQIFTMHELSIATKIPYATFYRTIHTMKDLVQTETVGQAKTISLNTSNPTLKSYLIISSDEEKKEFLAKKPLLQKIASELQTDNVVVLFGSYAKGSEKERSDIDLLIINKKGEKDISFSRYEQLFQKTINPIFVMYTEFSQMLKDKEENVGKQALMNHIILNNPERFWEVVVHG